MHTLYLFTPKCKAVNVWLQNHTSPEALWWGNSLVVEHRYVGDLAEALGHAGFLHGDHFTVEPAR